ncbi:branched-chain amino acid ABC transporter permease, partial [Thioclava sp. BHET1]
MQMSSRFRGQVVTLALGLLLMVVLPYTMDDFSLYQASLFAAMAIFGLSQGFVWGYAGILSFGQAAFFGLGAYAYAVVSINLGGSTWAMAAAVIVPALFAAALG